MAALRSPGQSAVKAAAAAAAVTTAAAPEHENRSRLLAKA
jgi:hypothetical protein